MFRRLRWFRYFWQWLTRGWDDRELWNLDETLAQIIVARLKRYRQTAVGAPCDCDADSHGEHTCHEKWEAKLDAMVAAFWHFTPENECWPRLPVPPHVRDGLRLFADNFEALWT